MHEAKIDRSQNNSHKINIKSMLKKTSIKDVYKHYPLKVIILCVDIYKIQLFRATIPYSIQLI